MKKILLCAVAAAFVTFLSAQTNKEDVDLIQAMYGKEKKGLVSEYMKFAGTDSTKFWSLYDKYETDRKALGRERISLLEQLATNFEKMDNKKAETLMGKFVDLNMKYSQFQKKYLPQFSAAVGGLQAAKFFQLENYLETAIRLAIQEEVPAIGNMEHMKKDLPKH
jgi:hypothetical protein